MEDPEKALRATFQVGTVRPATAGDPNVVTTNRAAPWNCLSVKKHGSGFFLRRRGLAITCEHVRREARRAGGLLVVCPYTGGQLDWRHAWEVDVLSYTDCGCWGPGAVYEQTTGAVHLVGDADAAVLHIRREQCSVPCEWSTPRNPVRCAEPQSGISPIG